MEFYKLNGIGNDFILIDHRNGYLQKREIETAIKLCHIYMEGPAEISFKGEVMI